MLPLAALRYGARETLVQAKPRHKLTHLLLERHIIILRSIAAAPTGEIGGRQIQEASQGLDRFCRPLPVNKLRHPVRHAHPQDGASEQIHIGAC